MQASTHLRRPSLSRAPLVLAALSLFGCGEGQQRSTESGSAPASTASAQLEHLELRLVDERAPQASSEARVLSKLYPPAGVAPWVAEGLRVFQTLVPAGPGERELPGYTESGKAPQAPALVLLQDAGKPREVRVPGEFDPASFNQVLLRVAVPQEEEMVVALFSGDRELARSRAVSVAGDPLPQRVVFDLPVLRNVEGLLDELRIQAAGHAPGLMVLEVALVHTPLASFIPPVGTPRLVDLGAERFDERFGVGLEQGAPAEVVFDATSDEVLAFSYGVPVDLRLPGSHAQLVVRVQAADGRQTETVLPLSSARPIWRRARISLAKLGDGQKRALFEIRSARGSGEELCAVTELRVLRELESPPTLVLVTSDTHRGDHIGALGPEAPVKTPALDALAARGVLFSDAFAASNTTNPSHSSLMTGVHVRDTRVLDNRSPLVGQARTLAEAFRAAGYHTLAAVSVRHLMDDESGLGQGFDRMSGPVGPVRNARETTTQAVTWLDELAGEPLFLWIHVFDAHSPYEPPASTDRRYYTKNRDPFDPARKLEFQGEFLPVYLRGVTDIDFPYAQYRAEIDALDHELARVLEHPRLASAVVAFTADHGESFGAHGIYWDHAGLYPDSLHVPLILAWPGGPRGTRSDAPVRQMDLGRTLLDLAGEADTAFGGRDLRESLGAEPPAETRYSIAKDGNSASILDGGWLLVLNLRDHQPTAAITPRRRHALELYDLGSDPTAEDECSAAHHDRARELRARLIDWLENAAPRGLASEGQTTAEQRQRLAGLGYTDSGADESVRSGAWFDADCDCEECAKYSGD